MIDPMRPDLRLWIETAVGKNMRDWVPVENVHAYLVDRSLAQLLWYWRYDVPPRWDKLIIRTDWSLLGRQLTQFSAMDIQEGVDEAVPAVYEALRACDWESIRAIPPQIWEWIRQLTCLSEGEWERVPGLAADLLNSNLRCHTCNLQGKLKDVTEIKGVPDPFMFGSSGALHLVCRHCRVSAPFDMPLL